MNKVSKFFRKSVSLSPQAVNSALSGSGGMERSIYGSSQSNSNPSLSTSPNHISNSTSSSFVQYHKLPLIDFDQIFQSFLKEGEIVKSYFLIHCVLSRKGPSSGNLHNNHTPKSWQPFFKKNSSPAFLVLCNSVVLLLDASSHPFSLLRRIPRDELKELSIDSSDVGLFSIELVAKAHQHHRLDSIQNNVLYFSAGTEKRDLIDQVETSFIDNYKDLVTNGGFIVRRCSMLASEQQIQKKLLKETVTTMLDEMSLMGFSAQDLWDGEVDLKLFVSKIKDQIIINGDDRYIVEFILPEIIGNESKRVYRVPNNLASKDIVHFLCTKTQLMNSQSYSLCTIKGREINGDDNLAEYGLGSFFDRWQLCLVERGKVRKAGMFELEVHFPEGAEFAGRHQRIIECDGYMPASQLIKEIGKRMDIAKYHLYSIRLEPPSTMGPSIILADDDVLSKHGVGSKYRKCKLRLIPKKFPKASLDKQKNLNIISLIINEIIETSWIDYKERSIVVKEVKCKEIVNSMIERAVDECIRASSLTIRMAALSSKSRLAMYKYLAQKEQEELAFYKMAGQKRVVDEAKDIVHGLTTVLGPSLNTVIDDVDEKSSLQVRIPPPPPPPILGFKNFKPKARSDAPAPITSSQSKSGQNLKSAAALGNALDMSQILGMRDKLRSANNNNNNASSSSSQHHHEITNESILKSVKLRSTDTSNKGQIQVINSKETNELMLKLQKRNAVVQSALAEAEELGDTTV